MKQSQESGVIEQYSNEKIILLTLTQPRKAFRYIIENQSKSLVYTLLLLGGVAEGFTKAFSSNSGDILPLLAIILNAVILGGSMGWISFFLFSLFVTWTGRWFDGKGSSDAMLRVYSLTLIPSILLLFTYFIKILIFEKSIFESSFDISDYSQIAQIVYAVTEILEYALNIWSLILIVIGISEVHKFTVVKALLSLIVPVLLVFSIIYVVATILS